MKNIFIIILIGTLFTSCANLKKSLITGASIGAIGGAAIGNSSGTGNERNRNTQKGAMVGALLGAVISYLAHKDKQRELLDKNKDSLKSMDTPLLTRPKVKRVWVEDKISGKKYIKGHWEYVIEEQSNWSQK